MSRTGTVGVLPRLVSLNPRPGPRRLGHERCVCGRAPRYRRRHRHKSRGAAHRHAELHGKSNSNWQSTAARYATRALDSALGRNTNAKECFRALIDTCTCTCTCTKVLIGFGVATDFDARSSNKARVSRLGPSSAGSLWRLRKCAVQTFTVKPGGYSPKHGPWRWLAADWLCRGLVSGSRVSGSRGSCGGGTLPGTLPGTVGSVCETVCHRATALLRGQAESATAES